MKKFKAESQRLLELMINSIYTNKEIFLRELISNASDALDKLHFISLTDSDATRDFCIFISADKEARTLTIMDNGIGMNEKELDENLGTIAKSGTLAFKKENENEEGLIGQFGVGFYSAFMVADKVTVITRKYGDPAGYMWESTGVEGYSITPIDKEDCGTTVILHLKPDDDDCKYIKFTEEYEIAELIKKYSDYIRYPIQTYRTRKEKVDDKERDVTETVTLNSMTAIWKRPKGSVTREEFDAFIKSKYYEFESPLAVFNAAIEGNINYNMLVYIPAKAPINYYSKEYRKGLELYSSGVLITDCCSELLPDYLGFVKGLIDTPEVSLNISRELLQKDRQLHIIADSLEKKILAELKKLMESDRACYEKIMKEFGLSLKFGAYNNFGEKKDKIKDLLLFESSAGKMTSFKEYIERMKPEQEFIYYVCGRSLDGIKKMPQTEKILSDGYEILYLTEHIDEFVMKILDEYDGKKFKSVSDKEFNTDTDNKQYETLCEKLKNALGDEVKAVRVSSRLKSAPVCITADGQISLEMERVFSAMGDSIKAERVLELNPEHPVFKKLLDFETENNEDKLALYAKALYNIALLYEGMPLKDGGSLAEIIEKLL